MEKNKNVSVGVTYGVLIGLVYVIIAYWRWSSASSMVMFGILALVGYLIILGMMFYEAYQRRKVNGGWISLKDLFQTLFISVLIFELFYLIYNYIHLSYIDPDVTERMKAGLEEMFDKAGDSVSDTDREKALSQFDKLKDATQFTEMAKSYFMSIAISGVFAFFISLIMRKKKQVFEEIN